MLSLAKILENMEIGHNVMHGQWDWMNDPQINSSTWDWDSASTAEAWKHSHNYVHHTYTNIRGKDRDLGYEIMRIDPHQKWHPVYLAQPFYNLVLAALFEWGVATPRPRLRGDQEGREVQGADPPRAQGHGAQGASADHQGLHRLPGAQRAGRDGRRAARAARRAGASRAQARARRRVEQGHGARPQESVLRQLIERAPSGAPFKTTLKADVTANVVRNVWAYAIIFCGHFPDQTYTFSQEETADETRGGFYVRQLLGAANIEGSPLFHVISGNLGYQVEHHLYPDMPSTRYAEIAPRVKELCERYELPVQHRPVPQAARHGAAHDPAAGVPGRQAAPEARAVPRRRERVDGGERHAPPRSDGARWLRPRAADGRRAGVHAPGGLSAQAPPGGQADPADRTAKLNLATGPGAPLGASARTARVCLPGRTR